MNEIRRLEQQIGELQRELRIQNERAEEMRQEFAEENFKKLTAYQNEMRVQLDRHNKEVREEYDRLLKEYQDSVNEEAEEQKLKMDIEYQKLLASTEKKEAEWREKTKRLQELIDEIKENGVEKDKYSAEEAGRYMAEAALAYKTVEKKPHEKFFPKRMNVFYHAIKEASALFESGLNEAAIAISISAKSGVNRLGYEVDDELKTWQRQYYILKSKVSSFDIKRKEEIEIWAEYLQNTISDEKDKQSFVVEIDFWSEGRYGAMCGYIDELQAEIERAEAWGTEVYLKRESSMSRDDIKRHIAKIDEFEKEFAGVRDLYKQRYEASCQRSDWGEQIIDYLENEINLLWIEEESHFKYVEEETCDSEAYKSYMDTFFEADCDRVDMREWLELAFKSVSAKIYIYIIPYESGLSVENRIVLYIDFDGAANDEYIRQVYRHVCESIGIEAEEGIIHFATDIAQLKTNMNRMLRETGRSIERKMKR